MWRHATCQEADVGAALWGDQPNAGRIPPTAPTGFPSTPSTPRHQGSHEGGLNSLGQWSNSRGYETVSWVGEDGGAVGEAAAARGAPSVAPVAPSSGVRLAELSAEWWLSARHSGAKRGASTPSSGSTSVSRVRDGDKVSPNDVKDDDVRKLFSSPNVGPDAVRSRIHSLSAELDARSDVLNRYAHLLEPQRAANVQTPLVDDFALQINPIRASYERDYGARDAHESVCTAKLPLTTEG
jgi:hypothetical protein